MQNTKNIMTQASNNYVNKGLANLAEIYPDKVQIVHDGNVKNTFTFYRKGEKSYMQVNDALAAGLRKMSATDAVTNNMLWKVCLGYPAKILRAGATQYNPTFIIKNFMRDSWTAFLQGKNGLIPILDSLLAIVDVAKKNTNYQDFLASVASFSGFMNWNKYQNS
jgi:hypothetical protein